VIVPWLDAVMTAQVLVPALGEGPASLSAWARAPLDEAAGGTYRGLVITDALDVAAVAEGPGYAEAVVRADQAGAPLVSQGPSLRRDAQQLLREAHDALVEAVASGRLPRAILRERAEETRARCRRLRVRRRVVPAGGLEDAITRAEELGAGGA